jgi:membrane-bound lytic murein transglycosylase A
MLVGAVAQEVRGARLEPLGFSDLADWRTEDFRRPFAAFLASCGKPDRTRSAATASALALSCTEARRLVNPTSAQARAFFEARFTPHRVAPTTGNAFFTGYFEPEFEGARRPDAQHSAPLLSIPKRMPSPAPDRAAIEDGALKGLATALVWLDPVDAFLVHIQGSARIRLDDGSGMWVAFAGRNGLPYTAIGKVLVDRGALTLDQVSMQTIRAWLSANRSEAASVLRQNRSYIFFRRDDRTAGGPVGAAGVPLVPEHSLAVDRSAWTLGLPVWVSTDMPQAGGGERPFRRLTIAQDTGAAIKGAARADIFTGTGEAAGAVAGLLKHSGDFVVLLPKGAKP